MLGDRQIREKREYPREACFMAVDYATQDRAYRDFIQNISRVGVFIETHVPLFVGEKVSLTFTPLNCQTTFKTTGEVVRSSSQGIGVKCTLNQSQEVNENKTIKRKKLVGRRRNKRYQVRDGGFALLNRPYSILGKIEDINMNGLSFTYTGGETVAPESYEVDVVFVDDGSYLFKVPFKTISDLKISKEIRRCGILFGQLTDSQLSQLEFLIQKHTRGHV